MKDISAESWINPLHLEQKPAYTHEALHHGVVLDHALLPDQLLPVEEFMRTQAEYRELYRLKNIKGQPEVTRKEWLAAAPNDRFCFREFLLDSGLERKESGGSRSLSALQEFFQSPVFARFLHSMTGELYVTRVMAWVRHRQGHFLVEHDDLPFGKMLSAILYLSSGWQEGFGGELTLLKNGSEIGRVAPLFNRLVLLKPQDGFEHRVEPLTQTAETWQRCCVVLRCYDPRHKLHSEK